jgi:hypothetical protein
MEYPAHCINSPAYGSKSEDKITTAQGGGPQILSAFVKQTTYQPLAHGNFAHPRLSSHSGELFWKDQQSSARVARENTTQYFLGS